MEKTVINLSLILLAASALVLGAFQPETPAKAGDQITPSTQETGPAFVEADGNLRANQSALLTWQTSGIVERVQIGTNQPVSRGQALAMIEPTSLPNNIILAQANLVEAQKALDELLNSDLKRAQAQQAVEDAQQALDDLLHPEVGQAKALENVTSAQQAVDQAELQVYILTTPPAQSVIEQAHANLLLAEKRVDNTRTQLEKMQKKQKKLTQLPVAVRGQLRAVFRKGIDGLGTQLNQNQIALDEATEKYNKLLAPADPNDLAQAQAVLKTAQAKLADAQREYARLESGPSPGDVALAQAQLADAQREWERLKDGPDQADIAAAQARVVAAQVAIDQARLTAPFAGVITQVNAQSGDQVEPGELAFRLDDLTKLLADVQVSENDINQVQIGQPATLTLDGTPGKEYHGTVVAVAPVGTLERGVASFATTIELNDSDQAVHPGMTVSAKIEVSTQ